MEKKLYENNEKVFLNEETATRFFKQVCDTDMWKRAYTRELHVVPVDPVPILMQEIRDKIKASATVTDESMQQCMDESMLALSMPMETRYEAFPIGNTAYGSLLQRAGYQSSPVLTCMSDKASQKAMSPHSKAEVLNIGLGCYNNKSLALIRDEKVRAVHSGDDEDYSILRYDELLATLKSGLETQFDQIKFHDATASHEYFTTTYEIEDKNLNHEITSVFSKAGIDVKNMVPSVRLISSDVGISGANIYPLIRNNTITRMIGLPLVLTHKHRHDITDFAANVSKVMAMFKEASAKLSEMEQEKVKNPAGCLLRIAKHVGLPKKISCEAAPIFEDMFRTNACQIDVYWKLFELLDDYVATSNVSINRKYQIEEGICRFAFTNMADYDMPFQWE